MADRVTDSYIKKALEEEIHLAEYVDESYCRPIELKTIKSALDLINRKDAEIERLKNDLEFKCDDCENIKLSRKEYRKAVLQAKSEAIKEFAERVETALDERVSEKIRERNPHWYLAKRIVRETSIEMTEVSE